MKIKHILTLAWVLTGLAMNGAGQTASAGAKAQHLMIPLDSFKWEAPPAGMVRGKPALEQGDLRYARLEGDPAQPGAPFTIALGCSDSKVAPHWHPTDENIVILKGTFALARGDSYDAAALHDLPTGGYAFMPKRAKHFAECKGEVIVLVYGTGPFRINFVGATGTAKGKSGGR